MVLKNRYDELTSSAHQTFLEAYNTAFNGTAFSLQALPASRPPSPFQIPVRLKKLTLQQTSSNYVLKQSQSAFHSSCHLPETS